MILPLYFDSINTAYENIILHTWNDNVYFR